MTEVQFIERMITFCQTIQKVDTLKGQQQLSFQMRVGGADVPYLSSLDSNTIEAAPTAKQKNLRRLFDMTAEGKKMLKKYKLWCDEGGVHFTQRVGNDVISLLP